MNGLPVNVTDLVILAVLVLSGLLAFLRGLPGVIGDEPRAGALRVTPGLPQSGWPR